MKITREEAFEVLEIEVNHLRPIQRLRACQCRIGLAAVLMVGERSRPRFNSLLMLHIAGDRG